MDFGKAILSVISLVLPTEIMSERTKEAKSVGSSDGKQKAG